MLLFFFIFSFIFGLLIGSFINCIVYRLHQKISFLSGRSFCPHCKKPIAWFDNIPIISYLILHGHCRSCQKKISPQYPFVELASGILFLLVAVHIYPTLLIPGYSLSLITSLILVRNWLFAAILLFIFLYDFKYYLIPDIVVLPATVLAVILNLIITATNNSSLNLLIYPTHNTLVFAVGGQFINLLISALLGGGFFLLLFVISKGKWIGGGDIRLGLLLGALLGWPSILAAFFMAYVSGAIVGVFLIILKKKTMSSALPFGTFLTVSAFIALLYGPWLVNKYLALTF